MSAPVDLTGRRFGRWLVVERALSSEKQRKRWLCRCDCGAQAIVIGENLRSGGSQSCGCATREATQKRNLKHGYASRGHKTAEYQSWVGMRDRCNNPNNKRHRNYRGRGIIVCARWDDFEAFLADMGSRPTGASLDRFPNNDGNYEPGNCRWGTEEEQARNRRSTKLNERKAALIRTRLLEGALLREVAEEFGVSLSNVEFVKKGKTWS